MEILQTIALLCQIGGGNGAFTDKIQLTCQQYYLKCVESSYPVTTYKELGQCIKERKL